MASQEFIVLYTHQKTKKSKVWQDGILKISFSRNKATLYDDKGQCLESLFLKQSEVKPGDDLESDRYLITVEDVKNAENIPSNLEFRTEVPKLSVQELKPSNKPKPCPPTGLKRKFTGFQGPRQVPKKLATIENNESAASLLSEESCPTFSSLFFCTPPLFSTTAKKNRDTVRPSDCNSVIDYKNSNTNDMSISLLLSTPSITSNQKGFCDEDDYSFLNSVTRKSDGSLYPEYMREDCLTTRGSATSQNVRSKEQILALLKSKPTPALEVVERFSPGQLTEEIKGPLKPQCIIGREEKITEMNNTKNTSHQCHLEKNVRRRNRWDVYLPKSLSASSSDVSNTEGKSKDQEDNLDLDLKGPFEQKEMHLFANGSEKKVVCKTDSQIDNDDQTTCHQKINFQVSSSCQSELGTNLPVICSNNEHHYLLSESKSEMLFSNDYPECIKGSIFTRENVQELNKTGVPERESRLKLSSQPEWEYPQLQRDSCCIGNNLAISDNLGTFVSKSRAENENIKINTDLNSKPETFLEVTFNLDNFDISDSEEESQNSNIFPLGSEHSVKKISSEDKVFAERKFEDRDSSQEDDNEHLSHLITINSSPPAKFPSKKTLSSQICTETSMDFDRIGKGNEASFLFNPNLPEVENVEEMPVDTSNFETLSIGTKWDSSSKQTNDVLIYGNGRCNGSVHPSITDYDHVSSQSKSKDIENTSHPPSLSRIGMTQTSKDNMLLFAKDSGYDYILGNYLQDGPLPIKNDRLHLLSTDQNYDSDSKWDLFDMSSTQISDTPFWEKRHPISKEIGVYEFEDTESMESLPSKVETNKECRKYWDNAENSFGLTELVNNMSLLRSLTEHSTALESLEKLKERNPDFSHRENHHRIHLTCEPVKSTAKKQFTEACYSSDTPERLNLYQDSTQQVLQENQDEISAVPNGSFESLQSSSLKDEEENAFVAFIPKEKERKSCKPKPVEFQGHRVAGSASSEVMVRGPCSQLEWNHYPDSVEYESFTEGPCFLTQKLPSNCMMTDFSQPSDGENFLEKGLTFRGEDDFQMTTDFIKDPNENDSSVLDFPFTDSDNTVSSYSLDHNLKLSEWSSWERNKIMSPVQKISTLSPDSTFPLTPRDEDIMIKLPEESLKARTSSGVEKFSCSEKVNVQRLHRTRTPLITLPPVTVHPLSENCSHRMDSEVQKSFSSAILDSSCEESAGSPVSFFGPEDRNRETSVSQKSGEETPIRLSFSSLVPPLSKQSRWLKYQNTPQGDSITLHRSDVKVNESFFAASAPRMHLDEPEGYQNGAAKKSPKDSVHLEMIKGKLHEQQADFYCQESVFRKKTLFQKCEQTSQTEEVQKILSQTAHNGFSVTGSTQINASALSFPSGQISKCACIPKRQIHIPAIFQSPAQYKLVFTTSLIEHLNILLFEVSKRLHQALSKVDISFYTSMKAEKKKNTGNSIPTCHHQQPAKLVMVKKEGPNKGRLFYTCDAPKANQCKFFKWLEEVTPVNLARAESVPSTVLHDIKSTGIYLRCQNIPLYEECQLLVRKGFDFQNKQYGKSKRFAHVNPEFHNESKSKLYLKLSRRESSSSYGKDDLWVISKTLDFELDTFIACSVFFGPSSYNEVELLPLKGYFPSNWPSDTVVHALLVCNASTELTTLRNLQEYFNPTTLPIIQHLLTTSSQTEHSSNRISKRKFIPPALNRSTNKSCEPLNPEAALRLANEMIQIYKLNTDQATALIQIAQMMASHENVNDLQEQHTIPITVIHGVFGAGKSYLLGVVILFLVQLFEKSPAPTGVDARPWKILISSSTNVAVDRVLLGLLSLGFEKFIRVGSIRKISKPILPYSLHAGLGNENEQLKELHALMKEDLTPVEKIYVRKSIEQHKLGTNRALLKQVQVVGITCAACPFPCMNNLKFPIVVLDECSQMTEPASLLPIARFDCEKLILVGDPKQLPPTIQGSESAHDSGLEQTLFDRLCLMGHKAILLRTQYRCHPAISAIANDLFYEGDLINGISEVERSPLLEWLPTLCFYNVKGIEQIERDNSFHNVAEAAFTLKLIQSLIASGIEGSMIGVITLYKSQMYKLCTLLSAVHCDHRTLKAVQVSTVDAFQGAEKEIIILSCVRTKQVGFIDSEKRMNVALTRGKRHLLIVGNLDCLKKNRLWGRVIQHCEGRENGLQHSSQCEPDLNLLLKSYLEKKEEEKEKNQKENSKNKSLSQKDTI